VTNQLPLSSVWIAAGGALGALARYGTDAVFGEVLQLNDTFPWCTLTINVSGSFLLAWILARAKAGDPAWERLRCFAGIGFCGAFTTFSTMNLEMVTMARSQAFSSAVLYFTASFVFGIVAAWGGACLGLEKRKDPL
jgi:CrcB protein